MRIAREEIFGPVVSVIPVDSLEEAIEVGNGVEYGLSAAIYTHDINKAFRAMRDMYTGIFYVNAPTIGAETHLPFGGTKNTGNGHREACVQALDVFSEWKSIYIDYSGTLQRAQIDTGLTSAARPRHEAGRPPTHRFRSGLCQRPRSSSARQEIKDNEYRVGLVPGGVQALADSRPPRAGPGRRRRRVRASPTTNTARAGAEIVADAADGLERAEIVVKVKEPLAAEYAHAARGPDPLHLPAPRPAARADPRAAGPQGHRHRLRDDRAAGRLAAAADAR